jgi:hypothetical protein
MVRTGQLKAMKPSVKDISAVELAKRDARNNVQYMECVESVELEVCWELHGVCGERIIGGML